MQRHPEQDESRHGEVLDGAVCWLAATCLECGALVEGDTCWNCGVPRTLAPAQRTETPED